MRDARQTLQARTPAFPDRLGPLSSAHRFHFDPPLRKSSGVSAGEAAFGGARPHRVVAPVVGPGAHNHFHRHHGAAFHFDQPHELPRGIKRREIVAAHPTPPRDDEKVGQLHAAFGGYESRLEDRTVRDVSALHPIRHARVDGKFATFFAIEQRVEKRRAIEGWEAEPVDPTVRIDERRGHAIADQCVFFDRAVGVGHGRNKWRHAVSQRDRRAPHWEHDCRSLFAMPSKILPPHEARRRSH